MANADSGEDTVAQRIRKVRHSLAPGELKVAVAISSGYPTAGLVTVAQLAAKAGVSTPTVLRLVQKIGYSGYPAFQEALRDEVQSRLFSPVAVYPNGDGGQTAVAGSEIAVAANDYIEGVRATISDVSVADLERAVEALADLDRTVMVLGGRFTSVLAVQLHQYLRILRPGVIFVNPTSAEYMTSLVDIDANTTVMTYDYRRYQHTTIDWGYAAVDRGARLILMTDTYLSPLSSKADAVLATSHAGPGPFDSLAHGFMLTELLVSAVAKKVGGPARDRLAAFEAMHLAEEDGFPVLSDP